MGAAASTATNPNNPIRSLIDRTAPVSRTLNVSAGASIKMTSHDPARSPIAVLYHSGRPRVLTPRVNDSVAVAYPALR